jgi:DNA-binding MarR family transcriptional regulator
MVDPERQAELRRSIELFYFAYRAFTAGPDRMLAERGLGRVHHRILYFVGRNPDIVVNDLLGILDVSKQALNAPLRRLIEMKLVAVRVAAQDRRYKQLRLSAAGEKLESRLSGTQLEHLARVFESAGATAEQGWQAVMQALPQNA